MIAVNPQPNVFKKQIRKFFTVARICFHTDLGSQALYFDNDLDHTLELGKKKLTESKKKLALKIIKYRKHYCKSVTVGRNLRQEKIDS